MCIFANYMDRKTELIAIAINSKGVIDKIDCWDKGILCLMEDVVSLEIPHGVTRVHCQSNKIEELVVPNTVSELICQKNKIKNISFPNGSGLRVIFCEDNLLDYLDIPKPNHDKVTHIRCDKEVKGLGKYIDNKDFKLVLH